MQVQKIQSTNNYQNQSFKAKFINDRNGHFSKLWSETKTTDDLSKRISRFAEKLPDHTLEIIKAENTKLGTTYGVFNHNNGKYLEYLSQNRKMNLEYLLYGIEIDSNFFKEDDLPSLCYKKLTVNA